MTQRCPTWLACLLVMFACGGPETREEAVPAADRPPEASVAATASAAAGELGQVYLAYGEALANADLAALANLTAAELKTRLAGAADLPEAERGQLAQLLKGMRFEDPRIALERIEGRRGVLVAETFGESPLRPQFQADPAAGLRLADRKPLAVRRYTVVLFGEEAGGWRILRESQFSYHDPRPVFQSADGDRELDTLNVQFHCGLAAEADICSGAGLRADECWKCFAQLERDASHCDQVARDLEAQDAETFAVQIRFRRSDCRSQVASLTGDAELCAALPQEPILGRSFRRECLAQIADHDFFDGANLFDLDADGDGLTDRLEAFFNTSLANADTDGDGVDDFREVMHDLSNPLGEGRLGDHLR